MAGTSNSDRRQWDIGARSPLKILEEQTLNTHPQGSLSAVIEASRTAIGGEVEAVTQNVAKKHPILYEPIALIENEVNMAKARYYRS